MALMAAVESKQLRAVRLSHLFTPPSFGSQNGGSLAGECLGVRG